MATKAKDVIWGIYAIGTQKQIKVMEELDVLSEKLKGLVWKGPMASHLVQELYDACTTHLLSNPDLTKEDTSQMLADLTDQATDEEGVFHFDKFGELFAGTLEAMGIEPQPLKKEEPMSDEAKTKKESRVRAIVAKLPSIKTIGKGVGVAASTVVKPALKFYDGVSEGWTSKEKPERS